MSREATTSVREKGIQPTEEVVRAVARFAFVALALATGAVPAAAQDNFGMSAEARAYLDQALGEHEISTSHMRGRTGVAYTGPIQPDVALEEETDNPLGPDPVLDAALEWLWSTPDCAPPPNGGTP